ncbi:MAG: antibiotic biosynthesis monooxygenase [Deltaproteobacteria bacterium]|nr:antibiotic biosynthesis monooxygenase [Deltaproteobacteria bacterium]MBN2674029.1 antibiotic biosynthesis monooxygenase [Deltaproteobacteria bacterium]
MVIVHVFVDVKPDDVEAFKAASTANAKGSIQEPGIARFDVVQDIENPTQFILVEVYRTAEAPAKHKETSHYQTWRDTVAPMMNSPRRTIKLQNIHPDDSGWG